MTRTATADARRQTGVTEARPLRLRAMIESWEREGLIRAETAAQALKPESGRTQQVANPPGLVRRLEVLGHLGAVPVAAAGLVLAVSNVGLGVVLLIGLLIAVASPQTIRSAPSRAASALVRPPEPRHRATNLSAKIRGPRAHEVVLNGRSGVRSRTTTLVSTSSR